jgi:methyl coenzyme M reductase beta subunit
LGVFDLSVFDLSVFDLSVFDLSVFDLSVFDLNCVAQALPGQASRNLENLLGGNVASLIDRSKLASG